MSSSLFSALSYLGGSDGGFSSVEKDFGEIIALGAPLLGYSMSFLPLFCKGN